MIINDFKIRSYGLQELAQLYAPDLTPESATKRLSIWMRHNHQLWDELLEAGWKPGNRVLTPLQVQVILRYLGEP